MDADQAEANTEMQGQVDALRSRADEADLRAEASESRADMAELRADDSDTRADKAEGRTDAGDVRNEDDRRRIDDLEVRLDVDEAIIAELQSDGLINRDHAVHLQEALHTSRIIGAAIGIIMATHKVNQVEAFAILSRASQNSNRKVIALADQLVTSGDVGGLPAPPTSGSRRHAGSEARPATPRRAVGDTLSTLR